MNLRLPWRRPRRLTQRRCSGDSSSGSGGKSTDSVGGSGGLAAAAAAAVADSKKTETLKSYRFFMQLRLRYEGNNSWLV